MLQLPAHSNRSIDSSELDNNKNIYFRNPRTEILNSLNCGINQISFGKKINKDKKKKIRIPCPGPKNIVHPMSKPKQSFQNT
jgi:hypothetical protein